VQSVRFRLDQLEEMYALLHKKVLDVGIKGGSFKATMNTDQDIPETMDVETSIKIQMVEHKINDLVAQVSLMSP
jgi:hypothetical protein